MSAFSLNYDSICVLCNSPFDSGKEMGCPDCIKEQKIEQIETYINNLLRPKPIEKIDIHFIATHNGITFIEPHKVPAQHHLTSNLPLSSNFPPEYNI